MRRSVGVGRAVRKQREKKVYQTKGNELAAVQMTHVQQQMEVFKTHLETFARKHKKQINKDPEFRKQFQQMCLKIGVDPLASNKGFWAEILGVGDFYFELGVQIIHVCISSRASNGGILDLNELIRYLRNLRKAKVKHDGKSVTEVSQDDVYRAIQKLEVLGNGVKVIQVGHRKMLLSVPFELSADHTSILQLAQATGYTNDQTVKAQLRWTEERMQRSFSLLLREGLAWLDEHEGVKNYWFPSIKLKS